MVIVAEQVDGRLRRGWRFLGRWWSSALAGVVTAVLIAAVAVTQGDHFHAFNHSFSWPVVLLAATLICSVGGTVETTREIGQLRSQARRVAALYERAMSAETGLLDIVCEELRKLVSDLGLYSNGRASLFMCRDDHFTLVGRHSLNTTFSRSCGRARYPINAGVVGQAWADGRSETGEFPNPFPANRSDQPAKGWLDRQEKWGIERSTALGMAMKSSGYAAIRLEHADRQRLGVLVVETVSGTHITLADLDAVGSTYATLSGALHHLRDLDENELRARVVAYLPTR